MSRSRSRSFAIAKTYVTGWRKRSFMGNRSSPKRRRRRFRKRKRKDGSEIVRDSFLLCVRLRASGVRLLSGSKQFLGVKSAFRRIFVLEIGENVAFLRELDGLLCELRALFRGVALFAQAEVSEAGGLHVGGLQFFALGLA